MSIEQILQILTVCQGMWVFSISLFVLWHYIKVGFTDENMKWHIVSVVISYNLLTMATMITSYNNLYKWNDLWQATVMLAYILGDYAITVMLFRISKRHALKKLNDAKNTRPEL